MLCWLARAATKHPVTKTRPATACLVIQRTINTNRDLVCVAKLVITPAPGRSGALITRSRPGTGWRARIARWAAKCATNLQRPKAEMPHRWEAIASRAIATKMCTMGSSGRVASNAMRLTSGRISKIELVAHRYLHRRRVPANLSQTQTRGHCRDKKFPPIFFLCPLLAGDVVRPSSLGLCCGFRAGGITQF